MNAGPLAGSAPAFILDRRVSQMNAALRGHAEVPICVPRRCREGGRQSSRPMSSGPANRLTGMETERVTASTTIEAVPEAVFAVLADPSTHGDIDGTG